MKILFLDIDGVLNNSDKNFTFDESFGIFKGFDKLNPNLLKLFLNWIRDKKDIDLILSSSWRTDERLVEYLNKEGLPIKDVTSNGDKGESIANYLISNPGYTSIAILDDDVLHPVCRYLIQTSSRKGLEKKHLEKLNRVFDY